MQKSFHLVNILKDLARKKSKKPSKISSPVHHTSKILSDDGTVIAISFTGLFVVLFVDIISVILLLDLFKPVHNLTLLRRVY